MSVVDRQAPEHIRLRLGVTVSKAVGNAVTRNRVKRQIREWFRQFSGENKNLVEFIGDLVVIARPGAASLRSRAIFADLSQLAKRQLAGCREVSSRG